ncbi:threonine synthase [Gilvimarinus sp. SDUM040013]|uniref:Threonine synthase n=1 Tax=Gilvimarinus gilvus TaxID=3058038 RepID=A0ABU4RWN8_9GAMM|nr:threonine synthase [Gilvimarinus sp. SDUM040013]MDO3387003.1 threonine synthase [Gilvimarinus sp. SDUM040013]MDX6848103.1 threonine synthase [Gilvimarinus sp. SDUM040013]
MKYISTRGQAPSLSFEEVVLTGLASDGGLYVPETLPNFSKEEIASWAGLSYQELAFNIMKPFVAGEVPDDDLKALIEKAYASFRHDAIAPLVQTGHNEWILELFQGPTLAFKDFALQFLGHLLDYILKKRDQKVVVMGATSGDTGSAAIEGCRRCENIDIFILHPHNRVSNVQRRQMTTVLEDNVHNIALDGNFDDCQNMVKASFADQSFLPEGRQLVAVNSINWARIMAQIVYYFYASLALGGPHRPVSFSVPTGNFGDIFAGYLAKRMGLPIDQLIIATNSNDILHRCISANDHSKQELHHTLSPSMDIMVSSNFERMLFELYDRDGAAIATLMEDFKSGAMHLSETALSGARELFASYKVDDTRMLDVIRDVFEQTEYLLDPHTAIGVEAARATRRNQDVPMVCLATAHPAKFPEAVQKAGQDEEPKLPHHMADLFQREERYEVLPNDAETVHKFMTGHLAC